MIVKFDHISYSCSIVEKDSVYKQKFAGKYKILFEEIGLKNIQGKQRLFYQHHQYHDLIMLLSERYLPVEITAYEDCKKEKERFFIEQGRIVVETAKAQETEAFFREFGFKRQGEFMILKPILDKQEIVLEIRETMQEYYSRLDNHGFTSLAFWSNNLHSEKRKLETAGYEVTPVEELMVNHRKLKLCFVVGKQQEIVELIGTR